MMSVRLQAMDNQGSVGVVSYAGGVQWNGQTYPVDACRVERIEFRRLREQLDHVRPRHDILAELRRRRHVHDRRMATTRQSPPPTRSGCASRTVRWCTTAARSTSIVPDGIRVVNRLRTEDYLRGVVPREVAASWADAGAGRGAQAVQAQAVAARSYALAATHSRGRRPATRTVLPGVRRRGEA